MSPAAFGAVTLRCVRLVSPEAPGRHETRPAGAPCSWERSLWAAVCISDPIIAICHNSHPAKRHSAPCVHLNYSMGSAFVNSFPAKTFPHRQGRPAAAPERLRHPDAVYMGHLAVLDGHGRVSRIPPINIFFAAHCIANRPVSLDHHWVGSKVCCAVR